MEWKELKLRKMSPVQHELPTESHQELTKFPNSGLNTSQVYTTYDQFILTSTVKWII